MFFSPLFFFRIRCLEDIVSHVRWSRSFFSFVIDFSRYTYNSMSATNSASALAEQNPEDTYEQYEKYLNAGR